MKRRAHFTLKNKQAPDACPACGQSTGFLASHQRKFDPTIVYTSGQLCSECDKKVAPFMADLEKGVLIVCRACKNMACVPYDDQSKDIIDALRAQAGVPSGFILSHTNTCPNCEAHNDSEQGDTRA